MNIFGVLPRLLILATATFALSFAPGARAAQVTLGALSSSFGTAGFPYSGTIPISGGSGTYTIVTTTGLPTGLSAAIVGTVVSISGTPTQAVNSPNNLTVTVTDSAGNSGSGTYTLTIFPGFVSKVVVLAGDNQTAPVNTNVPVAPQVQVQDAFGNGVGFVSVDFAVASGGGSITGANQFADANGVATLGSWTLGTIAGTNTVTATAGSSPESALSALPSQPSVTITATGVGGTAVTLTKNGGDNQTAKINTALPIPPSVLAMDTFGNVSPNQSIVFTVSSGGGSVTGTPALTNAAGIATVGSWTLGPVFGINTLTATLSPINPMSPSVTFSSTAIGPPIIDSISFAPSAPVAGDAVTLTVAAHDPQNLPLTFTYDFGDGIMVSSPTHTFPAPGNYTVIVYVSNGYFTVQGTITIPVIASPSNNTFRAKIRMTLYPGASGNDTIDLLGSLHLFKGEVIPGSTLVLNIGGNAQTFLLDNSAHAANANATFQLHPQTALLQRQDQEARFHALFTGGGYAASILANATVNAQGFPDHVLATIMFKGRTLFANVPLKFKTIKNGGIRTVGLNTNARP